MRDGGIRPGIVRAHTLGPVSRLVVRDYSCQIPRVLFCEQCEGAESISIKRVPLSLKRISAMPLDADGHWCGSGCPKQSPPPSACAEVLRAEGGARCACVCDAPAPTQAIMTVLELPPSESCRSRVSLDSRYGTCDAIFFSSPCIHSQVKDSAHSATTPLAAFALALQRSGRAIEGPRPVW